MIHPKYLKATEEILKKISRERSAPKTDDTELVSATDGKVSLHLSLNSNGTVREAWHHGAKDAERAILERLCSIAADRPLRELSEHGIVYVEHGMRDATQAAPVQGLLTPDSADPAFVRPTKLIREAYRRYRAGHGAQPEKNFWSPPLSASWMALSEEQLTEKISQALKKAHETLRLFDVRFEVVGVHGPSRVVVSAVAQNIPGAAIGHALMQVEAELKRLLEPQLELVLESLEDRNKRLDRTQISREVPNREEAKI